MFRSLSVEVNIHPETVPAIYAFSLSITSRSLPGPLLSPSLLPKAVWLHEIHR